MDIGKIEFNNIRYQNMDIPDFLEPPKMPPIKVKVFNASENSLPEYETSGASGMDLRAAEDMDIYPGETRIIKTGLFVELPPFTEFQIRARSGIALKTKLRVANGVGTIDQCYRGELGIIMDNIGDDPIKIKKGERYAQLVLVPILKCSWEQVSSKDELNKTDRGEGGFGSTGTK